MGNPPSTGKSSSMVDRDGKKKDPLVVCFGEMLIDFVPTVGGVSHAQAPAFKKAPGGAPANVAIVIARLGGSSVFVGKVGDDEFGHMLSDILKQNNVDNSGVCFDSKARTAMTFVTLRADVSLIEEPCRSTQLAAMKIAKKAGCILSYDPNLRLALWPSPEGAKKEIMSIWDQTDIIKISEEEISFLTDGVDPYDDKVVLKKLYYPNVKLLLVTEGSEGCKYYTKEFKGKVGGVKVNCIDTTGAGDAFVSGLLNSFSADLNLYKDEKKLREALLFANARGALTVTERGAIPVLPPKLAVIQVLRKVEA